MVKALLKTFGNLDAGPFEEKINRIFIGKAKPKYWGILLELLAATNGALL